MSIPYVSVAVFDKHQLPHPPEKTLDGTALEAIVDADINRFEEYFGHLAPNDFTLADINRFEKYPHKRLHPIERASIKAYLHWKLFSDYANVDG